jgi:hypothetical protein
MIFDMVLNSAYEEDEPQEETGFQIPRHCEHCLRSIEGRQYMIGNLFYDKKCYQYRYVFQAAIAQEEKKLELKKRLHLGNPK